jgi:two-component system, OmpR family, phosphate regulon sensor histidine kinase PhoR
MGRLPIFWQIFLYGLLIVASLGVIGSIVVGWLEQEMLRQVEHELDASGVLLQEVVRGRTLADAETRLAVLREELGVRVTLIALDGRVLLDTGRDSDERDSDISRAEVEAARIVGVGGATREGSAGQKMMYRARRVDDPGAEVAFLSVGRPVTEIRAQAERLYWLLWATVALSTLIAMLLAFLLAGRVAPPLREVTDGAQRIAHGEYGHKLYLDGSDEATTLARAFNYMSAQLSRQFAQLDEDRQQLRAVLSSMVEGVIAIDAGQRILFANDRAGNMLEFAGKDAPGRRLWELVRQRPLQDLVRRVLAQPLERSETVECGGPSNKTFAVHVTQLPGEPVRGAVLVFSDTTELRRLERLRQDFVANVSHELKTPLSVIAACVETLLDGGVEDIANRGRFLEQIAEQADRLHALILDLLSLARIEAGAEHLVLQDLPLEGSMRDCLERHAERARSKGQRLEAVSSASDTVIARADEEAVREILDNLVDNGLKYTPEGGAIRLCWWAEGDTCYIEVSDTGIGIADHDLSRIFERFYRVDKARSRELGGTGLGLSIVKHLAQAMQGSVRATSEVGQGTTFTVTLPRSSSPVVS